IGELEFTERKEELYQLQKRKFMGFMTERIYDFFYFEKSHESVFRTREVRVYDRETDELVAVSFFDDGQLSLAGLLAIYDPAYNKHSLGTYTMLLEVLYGIKKQKRFYYPGYTLDLPSPFDYKLRLGNLQYFSRHGRWASFSRSKEELSLGSEIRQKLEELQTILRQAGILFQKRLYPTFVLAYWEQMQHEQFFDQPAFLMLSDDNYRFLIAYYDSEKRSFCLAWVEVVEDYAIEDMNPSPEYLTAPGYYKQVLSYDQKLVQTQRKSELTNALRFLV
ncbi:MAG: hypothetical protein AAF740_04785, partial [Bacteroidota bacterium]